MKHMKTYHHNPPWVKGLRRPPGAVITYHIEIHIITLHHIPLKHMKTIDVVQLLVLTAFQRLILHLNIYLHEHFQVKRPLIKY